MKITQDMHIHTHLSLCSNDPAQTPATIIDKAVALGVTTLCITDHFWDEGVPGASDWYRLQNRAHLEEVRAEIPQDTRGVRVLVGCETEYTGGRNVGISRATAEELDFIVLPFDHFHMKNYTCPVSVKTPEAAACLWLERFSCALDLDLPWHKVTFAHINDILSFQDVLPRIFAAMDDDDLRRRFDRCARLGAYIEINTATCASPIWEAYLDTHLRIFSLARDCGCRFSFGSDAHHPRELESILRGEEVARLLGLRADQVLDPATLGQS